MPTPTNLPKLTKAEFDILRIIWKSRQLSVREVHDQIASDNHWAYSTTKTMMDRMVKKGLLVREQFHGVFVYRPLVSRPRGFARLVQFFADRVLEMDTDTVVAMFAQSKALTTEEIEELSELLKERQSGSG
jgi:predicted transcriptional regulator